MSSTHFFGLRLHCSSFWFPRCKCFFFRHRMQLLPTTHCTIPAQNRNSRQTQLYTGVWTYWNILHWKSYVFSPEVVRENCCWSFLFSRCLQMWLQMNDYCCLILLNAYRFVVPTIRWSYITVDVASFVAIVGHFNKNDIRYRSERKII